MKLSFLEKYFTMAFTYSGLRKLIYTYDLQYKQKINNKIEERPILYTDKVIHFLFAGVMGIGLAPKHFLNDMERLEMYVRNIKCFSNCCSKNNDIDFYTVLWDEHNVCQ